MTFLISPELCFAIGLCSDVGTPHGTGGRPGGARKPQSTQLKPHFQCPHVSKTSRRNKKRSEGEGADHPFFRGTTFRLCGVDGRAASVTGWSCGGGTGTRPALAAICGCGCGCAAAAGLTVLAKLPPRPPATGGVATIGMMVSRRPPLSESGHCPVVASGAPRVSEMLEGSEAAVSLVCRQRSRSALRSVSQSAKRVGYGVKDVPLRALHP